jgi:selenocysteine lyase/cysteine desulfurase
VTSFDVHDARARFPALAGDAVFFDAPGGSQVPASVTDAISTVLRETTANLGGVFATSVRTAQIVEQAHAAAGRFLGCDAGETIFGLNMTSLNFALTRALGRTLRRGDEILVTRLDHDANVAPWLELADDHGLQVRMVDIDPVDATLDFDDLAAKLGPRTRVVACNWASNACGTLTDVGRVSEMAHAAGALCWVDATHAAAHEPIDVRATGIDVLLCSPYKVCGPHLGLAYGRAAVLG